MILDKVNIQLPSPVQFVDSIYGAQVYIKRDDLIHPIISGNKYRKLVGNLLHFYDQDQYQEIISFGGSYSNHLHALAYCCHKLDIPLQAIIRGEEPKDLSPTLHDLIEWKTRLFFISRTEYRMRHSPDYLRKLQMARPQAFIIPEGGSNQYAAKGIAALWSEIETQDFDFLFLPIGSGGTMSHLLSSRTDMHRTAIIGASVLKGIVWESITAIPTFDADLGDAILYDFHFGGYAKKTTQLEATVRATWDQYQIPLETTYSAKTWFALIEQLKENPKTFAGKKILFLHTGGLQGNRTIPTPPSG